MTWNRPGCAKLEDRIDAVWAPRHIFQIDDTR